MKSYQVDVSRDGKFWLIHIPEIDRSTEAVRYRDVRMMAADLIQIIVGTTEFEMRVTVSPPS
ncbi:MAG TPA: hypothetical protein VM677_07395 [Actinokineospora sp.]|jgi:hypothetical protein|nr:hypothetical protein [Actinokineospora sp.]